MRKFIVLMTNIFIIVSCLLANLDYSSGGSENSRPGLEDAVLNPVGSSNGESAKSSLQESENAHL
ncbi:MAG TPA: hypothetical protein VF884_01775 [Nitrososphaeraceae archaeon]